MKNLKKSLSAAVSLALLTQMYALPIAYAANLQTPPSVVTKTHEENMEPGVVATEGSEFLDVDPNYNPFDEEESKPDPNRPLTMREKLEKIKQEETTKAEARRMGVSAVEGVQPGHIYIPRGIKFQVELVNPASSKKQKKNEMIPIRITDNLIVNDVIVVPAGTIGKAYVYEAQKAGGFGRKGVLRIAGQEIKTINGVKIPLRLGLQGTGYQDGGAIAVAAAVSLIGGIFMKGSNVDYPAGTTFDVEIRSNVDLGCKPEELAQVMDLNKPHGTSVTVSVK